MLLVTNMATAARPTLKCGHTFNDLVHLLTDEQRRILTCNHCKVAGSEHKMLSCGHAACPHCLRDRMQCANTRTSCPSSRCPQRHGVVRITEDKIGAAWLDRLVVAINRKSKAVATPPPPPRLRNLKMMAFL